MLPKPGKLRANLVCFGLALPKLSASVKLNIDSGQTLTLSAVVPTNMDGEETAVVRVLVTSGTSITGIGKLSTAVGSIG